MRSTGYTTLSLALSGLLALGCEKESSRTYDQPTQSRVEYKDNIPANCFSIISSDEHNRTKANEVRLNFNKAPGLSSIDRADLENYVAKFSLLPSKLYVMSAANLENQAECTKKYLQFATRIRFGQEVNVEHRQSKYAGVIVSTKFPEIKTPTTRKPVYKPRATTSQTPKVQEPTLKEQGHSKKQDTASSIPSINSDQFYQLINSDTPVVVDFYATWCGPCKQLETDLKTIKQDYQGKAVFARVNVDREKSLTAKVAPANKKDATLPIPIVLVYQNNNLMARIQGYDPRKIRHTLDTLL